MTTTPLTEQQLDEITAIATRATEHPFYVSDCEGSLQVWREKALTHVRRDEHGVIDMYSFPATYKVTDQIIELDLSTWDPGEDATDDQQRQDINDLVEARAALGALLEDLRRARDRVAELEGPAVEARAALAALCYDLEDPGSNALGALYLISRVTTGIDAPRDEAAQVLASHEAQVMRRCAEFVRDTYDGDWADDAASTLERDADVTEHGCPGYEDAGRGDTEAERQLANCKHCGRPRAVCVAAPAPAPAPPTASHSPAGDRDGETGTEGAAGRVGDSGHPIADADNPTPLHWGLDDVLWSDDNSVIVLMSGPDLEPYWLELDAAQAAVLRQNLEGPEGESGDLDPICAHENNGDWCDLEPGHDGNHRAGAAEWAQSPPAEETAR